MNTKERSEAIVKICMEVLDLDRVLLLVELELLKFHNDILKKDTERLREILSD